tara:strand:- start:1667 stop:2362 length:696 start_codon:yes stop_codon:yes gene_type:complete
MKEMLEFKAKLKKRMPKFKRQEINKRIRLRGSGWRKPRGSDSKMRLQKKGFQPIVKVGYRTPRKLRGRLANGLLEVNITSIEQIKNLNKDEIPVISRTLGNRKRLEILKEAKKLKISISNFKDIDSKITEIETQLVERKKIRTENKTKKTERKKKAQKEEKKKDKEKEKKSEPDKKSKKEEKPKEKKESKVKTEKKTTKPKPKAKQKPSKTKSKEKNNKKPAETKKEKTKK